MKLIAENTTIPVSRVYHTRWRAEGYPSEIVIDYFPPKLLHKTWEKLTHEQKLATCAQLRGYLCQLRNLKPTENRIVAVNGGPLTVGIRYPCKAGPFATEKEFNKFLVTKDTDRLPDMLKDYVRTMMADDDHAIHFAHGDFRSAKYHGRLGGPRECGS